MALRSATSLKKSLAEVFSCEVCKVFKNTCFYRTPLVTAFALPVAASVFFLKVIKRLLLFGNRVITY